MKLQVRLLALIGVFGAALPCRAQTWSTNPASNIFELPANWVGGVAPVTGGAVVFGSTTISDISLTAPLLDLASITFNGGPARYTLDSAHSSILGLGAAGLITAATNNSYIEFGTGLELRLNAAAAFNINAGTVHGRGLISGAFGLVKSGAGTLLLSGQSTFTGPVTVNAGTLLIGASSSVSSSPLGLGSLTLYAGSTFGGSRAAGTTGDAELAIANSVNFSNGITLGTGAAQSPSLRFTGVVRASDAATVVQLAPGQDVYFSGTLGGPALPAAITFSSASSSDRGFAMVTGTTDQYVSKITADRAGVIFGSSAALPATLTLNATQGGYLGFVDSTLALTGLSRISGVYRPTFNGTFGLDTLSKTAVPTTFTFSLLQPLNLTGFGPDLTLGSATRAILDGVITPPSTEYAFGNGGGTLVIRSALDGSRSVAVRSTTAGNDSLLAIFQGNNTYTGAFSVANSGAILDSAGALPAGRSITLGANSYVGYTEAFTGAPTFAAFIQRVAPGYTGTSIVGMDSHNWIAGEIAAPGSNSGGPRFVREPIDLTGLGPIVFGSATQAVVVGPVLAPNQSGANRTLSLIGVNGELEIGSPLVPGHVNNVVIGSPLLGGGKVILSGQSTYTGTTTLQGGSLILGSDSTVSSGGTILSGPLGLGTLVVTSAGAAPRLAADYWTTLANPIQLNGSLILGTDGSSFSPSYGWLSLAGTISGTGNLRIQGNTLLSGANLSFTGGVSLETGELSVGSNSALGTGTLTISPINSVFGAYATLSPDGLARTLGNSVVFSPTVTDSILQVAGDGSLTLTNTLTLNGELAIEPKQFPLYLNGPVTGSAPLVSGFGAYAPIILNGANTYSGGTIANGGAIIFGGASSIPATGQLLANYGGYIGVAVPSQQATFLSRVDRANTYGTIGFDSLTTSRNTFSNVDLSGFTSAPLLGSATHATLTGTLIPRGDYEFGGGGGLLDVNLPLVDAVGMPTPVRGVYVSSEATAPLTLRLSGANSYTGVTSVYGSAVVFAAGSLPPLPAGALSIMGAEFVGLGYIGTEDPTIGTNPQLLIDRFNPTTYSGIIGFDASPVSSGHIVNGPLVLTGFGGDVGTPRMFIGTTTAATVSGPITLPVGQTSYLFAGFKGGQLTVTSTLSGGAAVEIGDASTPATFRSPVDASGLLSTVILGGANTHSGGTVLYGGALGLGSAGALGSGPLSVRGMYSGVDGQSPTLFAATTGLNISSPIVLQSASLEISGTNALTLSGSISGDGYGLEKTGTGTLTLSGANTFSGGITVMGGNIAIAHPTAAGTGPLFLTSPVVVSAIFNTSATVNGIASDGAGTITISSPNTLTIDQSFSATYAGQFSGSGGGLVLRSSNQSDLRLSGNSVSFTGNVRLDPGITVVAASANALGASSNSVQLNGGTLAVDSAVTLSNPLTLSSGTLAGTGTFQTTNALNIGAGMTLSPGGADVPGTLNFAAPGTALTLIGGTYRWELFDAAPASGMWDQINVTGTVSIAADAPFTFKIAPITSLNMLGTVANFDPYAIQSWPVLNASAITVSGGTLASAFVFDTTYVGAQIAGGTFSMSLNQTGTTLLLNFTPVPEPSTYALLGVGAAVLLLAQRRRRRA